MVIGVFVCCYSAYKGPNCILNMHNKDELNMYKEEDESFNISNLPQYGYSFKEEEKGFSTEFRFSMTEEPKYVNRAMEDPIYFLDKYASAQPGPAAQKPKDFGPFKAPAQKPKQMEFPPYIKKPLHEKAPEKYAEFNFGYPQTEEQPIFVNASQYPYIKRRKERRDYLDSLEKKKDVGYQHESRHKHAMKRPRAPSGRFLTKEEAKSQSATPSPSVTQSANTLSQ
ncbi:hypothetical protein NECID01_2054 [Nematocida sp. AWRm77]|nr:hypothetical protein NECID01_2054 [Nematocida sp. AWRm77]